MYKSEKKRRYYGMSSYNRNYRYPWNRAEDEIVSSKSLPDADIASLLGRSVASIQKRRWYLRKKMMGGNNYAVNRKH